MLSSERGRGATIALHCDAGARDRRSGQGEGRSEFLLYALREIAARGHVAELSLSSPSRVYDLSRDRTKRTKREPLSLSCASRERSLLLLRLLKVSSAPSVACVCVEREREKASPALGVCTKSTDFFLSLSLSCVLRRSRLAHEELDALGRSPKSTRVFESTDSTQDSRFEALALASLLSRERERESARVHRTYIRAQIAADFALFETALVDVLASARDRFKSCGGSGTGEEDALSQRLSQQLRRVVGSSLAALAYGVATLGALEREAAAHGEASRASPAFLLKHTLVPLALSLSLSLS